ncbi:MAG: cyclic nucleotide-binding domain-containing protein [Alphaproteobacteria bacterium]|nr:cyclic nucleotide-binding domain-containing protein [Alphaproteobacteria bacterium]
MKETHFKLGETIYAEGEDSDCAYIIASGTVEVLRTAGDTVVPLAHLQMGQIFGEIGIIRNKPRSTTARAAVDTTLLTITKHDFDTAFGDKNPLALTILRTLCERLSSATQRIYEDHIHADEAALSEIAEIRLRPGSPEIASQIGQDGIVVDSLPFVVGRRADAADAASKKEAELLLRVTKQFEIAPRHFVIEEQNGGLAIRDNGSVLGTLVNGIRIAQFEQSDSALLKLGMTEVQVGGLESTIRFNLVVTGS